MRDMDGRANVDDTIDGNPKTKGLNVLCKESMRPKTHGHHVVPSPEG